MAEDRKDAVEGRVNQTVEESEGKRDRLLRELARFDQSVREGTMREPPRPSPQIPEERPHRGWRLPWSA